ncbi:MAG: type II toxin-antitoxin system Phd/YefM family antitoxin [Elusimicrobia bacterium]|nr:type II toxin-antitoxin system Phd/YefM family antitoxin [Elusimicrobiota bacterium]
MITVKHSATLASISELRTKSEEILSRLKENRVILERHSKPVAVMVDYAQYEKFEEMLELAEDLVLGSLAAARDRSAKKGDFVDLDKW